MSNKIKNFCTGPGILISTVMWEFFSIFGMRALLVLYLTQRLNFSDVKAFQLYAGYISLIWISPIIGGWIADKYLGYRYSVYVGSILIIAGHITMTLPFPSALYLGLSLLICGIGFFKTNAICLMGRYYKDEPEKISSSMTLYYIGANIGAMLAPIVCAYLQVDYGFNTAFIAAGIGMFVGLSVMLAGRKRFSDVASPLVSNKDLLRKACLTLPLFVLAITVLVYVLQNNMTGYVIIIGSAFAIFNLYKNQQLLSKKVSKKLLGVLGLTLIAMFFWVLDQQSGSSINLFILRNINKLGIPTGAFQAISSFAVIIGGLVLTLLIKSERSVTLFRQLIKVVVGLTILTLGYLAITLSAELATNSGLSSIWLPVLGLGMMGFAELFIDPVILSSINRETPTQLLSSITAIYYLFAGALANYISGKVAGLSAVNDKAPSLIASAKVYFNSFSEIAWVGVGVVTMLFIVIITIKSTMNRNLAC